VTLVPPKRVLFIFSLVFLLAGIPLRTSEATFIGETKTGLIEIKDFTYPVFLYVPDNIKPDRKYPLMIVVPDEGKDPTESIELWKGVAIRNTVMLLAVSIERIDDIPDEWDRWFFEMKSILTEMYPVNKKQIFLIGESGRTSYAAYLGFNYPEEFSAVALMGGSWVGKFEKLMRLQSHPTKQIPFYIALKSDQDALLEETEQKALELSEKGYPLQLTQFKKGEEYLNSKFKKQLILWLKEKSQTWQAVMATEQKTFKQKFKKAVRDFFAV